VKTLRPLRADCPPPTACKGCVHERLTPFARSVRSSGASFLLGFSFPDFIDSIWPVLSVSDLQTSSDDNAVLYTGTVYFPSGFGFERRPSAAYGSSGVSSISMT